MVGIRSAFMPPVLIESELGEFRLFRVPVQLTSGWCFGRRVQRICPHAGLLLEPTVRTATKSVAAVSGTDGSSFLSWGALAGVRFHRGLTSWMVLSADLSVAALFAVPEYRAADTPEPLLAPHQIRPRLDLGVTFPVFGKTVPTVFTRIAH
jgi:hypothetical protein